VGDRVVRDSLSTMKRILVLCALLLAGLAACSQRVTPEEEYSEQDRERPRVDPSAFGEPAEAPPAAAAPSGAGADLEAQALAGTIEGPESPPPGAVLFVFVRPAGAAVGPPIAVQRHPGASFPMTFSISPNDGMMGASAFPDRVTLEARLDADANAMTSGPDDWSDRLDDVVPGTGGVELRLQPGG